MVWLGTFLRVFLEERRAHIYAIVIASGPDMRIRAIAPLPCGVHCATIVSVIIDPHI